MQPPPKLILDRPDLGLHAFARRHQTALAPELEARTLLVDPTDMREAEEVERFRLALAAPVTVYSRMAAELDQARLLQVQGERKRRQSRPQIGEEAFGVVPVLEARDGIVRIANEDHVAGRMALPPLMGPQIVDVMKGDVRQQRRDYRPLRGSFLTLDPSPVFEHTHLQPFLDQADDPAVADAMFDEANQPCVADRIEEPRDVGVEDPLHVACLDPERERIQRIRVPIAIGGPGGRSSAEFPSVNCNGRPSCWPRPGRNP